MTVIEKGLVNIIEKWILIVIAKGTLLLSRKSGFYDYDNESGTITTPQKG